MRAFAQTGLGVDPTGGILVIVLFAVLAVAGFVICAISGIRLFRTTASRFKELLLFALGLGLASPALWFAFVIYAPDIPQDKSWDFSTSRSIAQLKEEKDVGPYYYQGNIRSTVKLPSNKQWSGHAYLVVFRTESGKIKDIHWQSRLADAPRTYEQTRRILQELALPDRDLDRWYAKVRRGEQASFSAVARSDTDASVEVQVRGSVKEGDWTVHVNVWW